MWVDLVDDEDVALMFDEWEDASAALAAQKPLTGHGRPSGGPASSRASQAKLHIFVQWRAAGGPMSGSLGDTDDSGSQKDGGGGGYGQGDDHNGGTNSQGEHGGDGRAPAGGQGQNADGRRGPYIVEEGMNGSTISAGAGQSAFNGTASSPSAQAAPSGAGDGATKASPRRRTAMDRLQSSVDLSLLVERMEIIPAADIALVRFLGSGGYGDVYLGKWHSCDVAVKCLNPALFFQGSETGTINRAAIVDLIREADMLGSLRHPAVVWVYGVSLMSLRLTPMACGCYDVLFHPFKVFVDHTVCLCTFLQLVLPDLKGTGPNGGSRQDGEPLTSHDLVDAIQAEAGQPSMMPGILRPPALVTEYMAGGSLKSALTRKADIVAGALTRVVLALDAAKGLEYLHSKGIVHFDLKSANLLLGYRDRRPVCKVADFGLAREKTQTFCSGVSSQRGTLPWTAPEILRTPNCVTEKVDVFSFGIVLWELWTGKEPYEGLNYHALMMQLANPEVRLRPPIPGTPEWEGEEGTGDAPLELAPGWQALMERCWAELPQDRPSFSQIIREMRGMVAALKPPRPGSQRASSR